MPPSTYTTDSVNIRGIKCFAHHWKGKVDTPPRALVVIFHGFLAHGNYPTVRYAAEFLSEEGYAVVAVDMPGHGQSEGTRGYLESAETVVLDGASIVEYAKGWYARKGQDNLKVVLVGSSMGGAIALAVAQTMESIAGVVLLAPMLKLNVNSIEHGALQFLAFFMSTIPLIPSSATDPTSQYRDERKRNECLEDTLSVSGSKLRVGSALACVDITLKIREKFSTISCPFLLMIADEDVVVKNEGSEELFETSPTTDKTKRHYPALHGLLCEPSPLFEEIKRDMLSWIKARV